MSARPLTRGAGLDDALRRVDALEEEARHRALHDPLTGLVNRRQFTRQLEGELARSGTAPCAVLFVDIDRFKLINDGHGHEAGDSLLREAGSRLQAALRDGAQRDGGPPDRLGRVRSTIRVRSISRVGGHGRGVSWCGRRRRPWASTGSPE